MKATLIAGRTSTDLEPHEVALLCRLIGDEHNRLTAQWAQRSATEAQRERLESLLRRLDMVRQAQEDRRR